MASDFTPKQAPEAATDARPARMKIRREDALEYHSSGRKGKIEVVPTKPCATARDLSLAYTPGVAEPCLEIAKDPDLSYTYTARGNLVAVVSNGTAVLGLGDIGPHAGKPVMEGKGVLFKKFADIDVFDIEVDAKDVDEVLHGGEGARADLRRHQPRGHQGARVLRHRGAAEEGDADPGLPRRPARHGDHLRRGAAQRRSSSPARSSTRSGWSSRAPARRPSPAPSSTSRSA